MELNQAVILMRDFLRKKFGENLVSIVLFGSAARGTAKPESDLDLCVVLEQAPRSTSEKIDIMLAAQKESKIEEPFSYIVYSRQEAMENRPLFLDMTIHAKILFDKDGFFAGRLEALKKRLKELGSRRVEMPDGSWYWDLKPDLKFGEVFTL